ncbi:hypothetical protein ABEB36_015010 [Hypothenemus hampei]|uniref:Uncharacterized protein n=1 Tax=Hypothenemus hampei TaxID=57062 RepID=A0ABD1E659_HYPHA
MVVGNALAWPLRKDINTEPYHTLLNLLPIVLMLFYPTQHPFALHGPVYLKRPVTKININKLTVIFKQNV